MSTSYESILLRFTPPWLIRFMELHPFTDIVSKPFNTRPITRLAVISPYFKELIKKHMPLIVFTGYVTFVNGRMIEPRTPPMKKPVVITGFDALRKVTPGIISRYYQQRVYFHNRTMKIEKSRLSLEDFSCLLHGCVNVFTEKCVFNEPITFSKIWLKVKHCESVKIDILNLVYDQHMERIMLSNPSKCHLLIFCNVTRNSFSHILNVLLKLPKIPEGLVFNFVRNDPGLDVHELSEAMKTKMIAAGHNFDKNEKTFIWLHINKSEKFITLNKVSS